MSPGPQLYLFAGASGTQCLAWGNQENVLTPSRGRWAEQVFHPLHPTHHIISKKLNGLKRNELVNLGEI